MSNYKHTPAVTYKYHIEVPIHEYYSGYCVYKASFGDKYFIGKGKALLQSAQAMALIIERALRLRNHDETSLHYHVITHIIRNSVQRGFVEVIGGEGLSEFELLKLEQEELNKCIDDPLCLNNNFDAYIPKWIKESEAQKFLQWKGISAEERIERARKKTKDSLFDIEYFDPSDKDKRGVYKLYFGQEFYYVGRGKLIYTRMLFHKKEIKKRLSGYTQMTDKDLYVKVIKCINDLNLKVATCRLVKECITVDELVQEEQKELDISKTDKYCLNLGFVSKKIPHEFDDTVEDSRKKPIVITKNGKRIFISPHKKKKDGRV